VEPDVIARANTRVTILRGTTTNAHGDTVDGTSAASAALTSLPASLIEVNRRTYLPAEGATRVVRTHVCRLTSGTDVRKDDRIQDAAGAIYQIVDLNASPGSPAHRPDIVIQLSKTT
jgi:hypothetical protein